MAVLITVPHGGTPNGDGEHNSDVGALKFLSFLEEALDAMSIPYTIMVGEVNRDILDLNRLRAHSHPWVVEVRKAMLEAEIHIDLHSYPKVSEPQQTSNNYDLLLWSQHTVVLFNTPDITDQGLLRAIESALEEVSIPTAEEQGGFENYLSNLASVLMDLPSVLIEVNEGETQDYPLVASGVAVGILNHLEYLDEPLLLAELA